MALLGMNEADSINPIMPREKEAFLMERIASGEQYAMEELIELWKMPMFRFFLRSLNGQVLIRGNRFETFAGFVLRRNFLRPSDESAHKQAQEQELADCRNFHKPAIQRTDRA